MASRKGVKPPTKSGSDPASASPTAAGGTPKAQAESASLDVFTAKVAQKAAESADQSTQPADLTSRQQSMAQAKKVSVEGEDKTAIADQLSAKKHPTAGPQQPATSEPPDRLAAAADRAGVLRSKYEQGGEGGASNEFDRTQDVLRGGGYTNPASARFEDAGLTGGGLAAAAPSLTGGNPAEPERPSGSSLVSDNTTDAVDDAVSGVASHASWIGAVAGAKAAEAIPTVVAAASGAPAAAAVVSGAAVAGVGTAAFQGTRSLDKATDGAVSDIGGKILNAAAFGIPGMVADSAVEREEQRIYHEAVAAGIEARAKLREAQQQEATTTGGGSTTPGVGRPLPDAPPDLPPGFVDPDALLPEQLRVGSILQGATGAGQGGGETVNPSPEDTGGGRSAGLPNSGLTYLDRHGLIGQPIPEDGTAAGTSSNPSATGGAVNPGDDGEDAWTGTTRTDEPDAVQTGPTGDLSHLLSADDD